MIELNITSLTYLTKLFIPLLKKQSEAYILNVASTAAFQPGPLMSVYYATKAYVLHFSEGLSEELKNTSVRVSTLCPGPTTSGFQKVAQIENTQLVKGRKLPTSKEVAEFGYLAMKRGCVVATHGTLNKILVFFVRFTPRFLMRKVMLKIQQNKI